MNQNKTTPTYMVNKCLSALPSYMIYYICKSISILTVPVKCWPLTFCLILSLNTCITYILSPKNGVHVYVSLAWDVVTMLIGPFQGSVFSLQLNRINMPRGINADFLKVVLNIFV